MSLEASGSIVDAGDSDAEVSAVGLRMVAGKGVGLLVGNSLTLPVDAFETTVARLSVWVAGSDGIHIAESDALTLGNVESAFDTDASVVVFRVGADGGRTQQSESSQSDVVTTAVNGSNGSIVISSGGSLTVESGDAVMDAESAAAVVAHGSGNILLVATGGGADLSIGAEADVRSTSGNMSLSGAAAMTLGSNVDVSTGDSGTIGLSTGTGDLTMAASAVVSAQSGDVSIEVGDTIDDVAVIGTVSTLADVLIAGGSILDADDASGGDDSHVDVVASSVFLHGDRGVGLLSGNSFAAAVNAIETDVAVLAALANGVDGIHVREKDALVIGDTGVVSINAVQADGSTVVTQRMGSRSDVRTTGISGANGSIVVETLAGDLTVTQGTVDAIGVGVSAHGTGNIRLSAQGSGSDLYVNAHADVLSAGGHVTVLAAETVDLGTSVDVRTVGSGSLDVEAVTGSVLMTESTVLGTVNGDLRVRAGDAVSDRITVGDIEAVNANVSLATPGSVHAVMAPGVGVQANGLRIEAGKGIGLQAGNSLGLPDQALATQVGVLSAHVSGSDGINILEADGLTVGTVTSAVLATSSVTVYRVGSGGAVAAQSEPTQSDVVSLASADGGANGTILLQSVSGDLVLTDGAGTDNPYVGGAVRADGSGHILLEAFGTLSEVVINSDVSTTSGHISVLGNAEVTFGVGVDVSTGGSGTVYVEATAAAGAILMDDESSLRSADGDIYLRAAGASAQVQVGDIQTNANVHIGTGGRIVAAADADAEVTAYGLSLSAGTGIGLLSGNSLGAAVSPIETQVTVLSATSGSGDGIHIVENGSLELGTVVSAVDASKSVVVSRVHIDGTTYASSVSSQSDVWTSAGNGPIVVRAVGGDLVLKAGSGVVDGAGAVRASGSGNILLAAEGSGRDVTVEDGADVVSVTGHVTVRAADALSMGSAVSVSTGGSGTLEVLAGTGSLLMSPTASLNTVSGDIRVVVGDDGADVVRLGAITASAANVSIAASGAVYDVDAAVDIVANALQVSAKSFGLLSGNSLGEAVNPVRTSVGVLAIAVSGADGIYVEESDDLTVGNVVSSSSLTAGTVVNAVQNDASVSTVSSATQSDVVSTGGNGSISLNTANGSLTLSSGSAVLNPSTGAVSAHGSGKVRLSAGGASSDVVMQGNAGVSSGSGSITVLAGSDVTVGLGADVVTGSAGTIEVEAFGGAVSLSVSSDLVSTSGSIRVKAGTSIALGGIIQTAGDVSLISGSGSITDVDTDASVDIAGRYLRMVSGGGIGSGANAVEVAVDRLAAQAVGGIYLTESDGLEIDDVSVTVVRVAADGGSAPITDALLSDVVASGPGSAVVITVLDGDLDLNDGSIGTGVSVGNGGTGNILLQVSQGDLVISDGAGLRSMGGSITLRSGSGVVFVGTPEVSTVGGGSVYVLAQSGSVRMSAGSRIATVDGNVRLVASGGIGSDIEVGRIEASNADVSLLASGSIEDAGVSGSNVVSRHLRVEAGLGIGVLGVGAQPLETTVEVLSARAGLNGINVYESNALSVDTTRVIAVNEVGVDGQIVAVVSDGALSDVRTLANAGSTGSGTIVLRSVGQLVLNDGTVPLDGNAVVAVGSGNIRLESIADGVMVSADVRSGSGDITVLADGDLVSGVNADILTGGSGVLDLAAGGAILLDTSGEFGSGSGDVRLSAGTNIYLGALIETTGAISLTAVSGSILESANVVPVAPTRHPMLAVNTTAVDLRASALRLVAGNGVGVLGAQADPIETAVSTVSARVGAGGLNLAESDALLVGSVLVQSRRVGIDGVSADNSDPLQSDLVSSDSGSLVVRTFGGDLIVVDGTAPLDGTGVVASGSGNILLEAVGAGTSVSLIADVESGTGSMTVRAAQNVSTTGVASLRTGGSGSIDVEAVNGSVTLSTSSDQATGSGDIRIRAGANVTLGGLVSTQGRVSLVALSGWIRDGDTDGSVDVSAAGLRFEAGRWVGQLGVNDNAIETTVERLGGQAGSEGITILESDALEVNAVGALVNRVGADGATVALEDVAVDEITTFENGSIVLRTVAGDIELNGGDPAAIRALGPPVGEGHILLAAQGEGSRILINRNVTSDSGDVTLVADLDVYAAETASVSTGLDATIEIMATNGSIEFERDSQVLTGNGDIELWAANNISLGGRISTNATVALLAQSGSIGDIFLDGTVVVQAGALVAQAGLNIGTTSNAMGIDVTRITAQGLRGGVYVSERNLLTVVDSVTWQINRVGPDGLLQGRAAASAAAGIVSDAGVSIEVRNGHLDLAAPVLARGDVRMTLVFGSVIDSHGGATDVRGSKLTVLADAVGNSANALETQVSGLDARATRGGIFIENSGALVVSAANAQGNAEIRSSGDLTVTAVSSTATARLSSVTGAILGSGTAGADVTAAVVELTAVEGIGGTGSAELDLQVATVVLRNTGTGSAYLNLLAATSIASIEMAGPGSVYVRSAADVSVDGVVSLNQGSLRAKVSADLQISGEILASGTIDLLAQDMSLESARLLSSNGDVRLRASGTLVVDAASSLEAPNGEVTTVSTVFQSTASVDAGERIEARAVEIGARVTALQSPVVRLHSGSGVIHSLDYLGSAGITGLRMTGTALRLPSLSVFSLMEQALERNQSEKESMGSPLL